MKYNLVLSTVLWLSYGILGRVNVTSSSEFLRDDKSLLWGTYRPNIYFGVRSSRPNGIQIGLVWVRVDDHSHMNNLRYTCEQNQNISGYGWDVYDARLGGSQCIHDVANGIDLTTEFIKDSTANDAGGNWGFRIRGQIRDGQPSDTKFAVFIQIALTDPDGYLNVETNVGPSGTQESVFLRGSASGVGKFSILFPSDINANNYYNHPKNTHPPPAAKYLDLIPDPSNTMVFSTSIKPELLWRTPGLILGMIETFNRRLHESNIDHNDVAFHNVFLIPNDAGPGNLHTIEKIFQGSFEFDVYFSADSSRRKMTRELFNEKLDSLNEKFITKFTSLFTPNTPFNTQPFREFSQVMFSNLLGGIGYLYGDWFVDDTLASEPNPPPYENLLDNNFNEDPSTNPNISRHGPNELLTLTPSRAFFPRGFLWDEGFHLLPIIDWDLDLTVKILQSWLNLMDNDGWIAREQILGDEARSKVPGKFQVQYSHHANPPTLFWTVSAIVSRLTQDTSTFPAGLSDFSSSRDTLVNMLDHIYALLRKNYHWFCETQQGDFTSYDRESHSMQGYRWRGRSLNHILPSGMDDYPRAEIPHPGELHVDALSWVGLMANSLKHLSGFLNLHEDEVEYTQHLHDIKKNLEDLHWSASREMYCDLTLTEFDEAEHVCHPGYVSLMPFITGLLDYPTDVNDKSLSHEEKLTLNSRLRSILDLISDPESLWSEYGIRSLGLDDQYFGTAENYWRGPVWINLNFMILQRLLELAQNSHFPLHDLAGSIYSKLRVNLVNVIYDNWKTTGFAWEQYNSETGSGQRTQHFTGWTSLVVNIMTLPDISVPTSDTSRDPSPFSKSDPVDTHSSMPGSNGEKVSSHHDEL